jgi:hypothetical protein
MLDTYLFGYIYWKDPAKTEGRSTKNFDNKNDAYMRLSEDGHVGVVKEIKGQVSACKYCPAHQSGSWRGR